MCAEVCAGSARAGFTGAAGRRFPRPLHLNRRLSAKRWPARTRGFRPPTPPQPSVAHSLRERFAGCAGSGPWRMGPGWPASAWERGSRVAGLPTIGGRELSPRDSMTARAALQRPHTAEAARSSMDICRRSSAKGHKRSLTTRKIVHLLAQASSKRPSIH